MAQRFGLVEGFVAGALAVLTFHQPAVAVLYALGLFPVAAFDLSPKPSGLPSLVQAMLWSGGWAVLLLLILRLPALRRVPVTPAAILYCAVVPVAFLFLVLAPSEGFPIAYGMPMSAALRVVLVHALWGFGIALWLHGLRGMLGGSALRRDPAIDVDHLAGDVTRPR